MSPFFPFYYLLLILLIIMIMIVTISSNIRSYLVYVYFFAN